MLNNTISFILSLNVNGYFLNKSIIKKKKKKKKKKKILY